MAGSLQHPTLGFLEWDDKLAWWIGKIDLKPGHPLEIFISGEGDPPEAVLTHVPGWLERIRSREFQYRRWTAEQVESGRWNLRFAHTLGRLWEFASDFFIQVGWQIPEFEEPLLHLR